MPSALPRAFGPSAQRSEPVFRLSEGLQGIEQTLGPVVKLVAALQDKPAELAAFRAELDGFIARYFENNTLRQHYLMTRATKK